MKPLPTLYKKNQNGKIELWSVTVVHKMYVSCVGVIFGEHKGKTQFKEYIVDKGKNEGRANETTRHEQAEKEAQSKWEKKLKQGYVKSLKDAQAGKTDEIITGGISPMLAHNYEDHKEKLKFPLYVQPKLDGQRCIAIFDGKKVTLWTRSRKPILSCPHIVEQLETAFKNHHKNLSGIILDGELYHHKLKDKFEELMSAVRKNKPSEESKKIQFHIYDVVQYNEPFRRRMSHLERFPDYYENLVLVETVLLFNEKAVENMRETYIRAGYEGIMVRNPDGVYECKRSKNLLKFKTFIDAEYPILRFEEGKDNTVVAVLTNGKCEFRATMSGTKKDNQKYLKGKYSGKLLTVKFFSYTNTNKVPRFPVGLRIRDEL